VISSSAPKGYDVAWRRRHLAGLILLCLAGGCALVIHSVQPSVRLDGGRDPIVDPQQCSAAAEKIDPNTASEASLRRLYGIGPSLARRIVEYRRRQPAQAFTQPGDLQNVPGIGPKTVAQNQEHLHITRK